MPLRLLQGGLERRFRRREEQLGGAQKQIYRGDFVNKIIKKTLKMAEDVEAVESVVVEGGDGDVEVVDVVVGEEVEALSLVNAGRDRRTELKRKSPEEEDEEASCIQQAKKASVEGDSGREDDDDGAVCNICMEAWTNSGEHRIASLKCGF